MTAPKFTAAEIVAAINQASITFRPGQDVDKATGCFWIYIFREEQDNQNPDEVVAGIFGYSDTDEDDYDQKTEKEAEIEKAVKECLRGVVFVLQAVENTTETLLAQAVLGYNLEAVFVGLLDFEYRLHAQIIPNLKTPA